MNASRTLTKWAIALLCLTSVACASDDAIAPAAQPTLDAGRVEADVAAMRGLMAAPAWTSFATMSERFDLSPVASSTLSSSRDLVSVGRNPSSAAMQRAASGLAIDILHPSVRAIRVESLGKTFRWDATAQRYVHAPDRTGAPPNGVRFLLYAINPVTHEPLVDHEIGYADLTDIGPALANGFGLRLQVVSGTLTALDYTVVIQGSENAGSLGVSGFLSDGTTRLQFVIDAHARSAGTTAALDVDFHFAIPERGLSVVAHVEGTHTAQGNAQKVDLTVRSGVSRIDVAVTEDERAVDATFHVNDQLFATARGDRHNPEIRGAGGRELTPQEMHALQHIVALAGGIFELFANLLKPVAAVLALSAVT
jgi:hypothetical protein